MDDLELLREYAEKNSESAFAKLVERHLNLVHSAARRQVDDAQMAEEITQAVFLILARKAATIRPPIVLAGWLFQTTRFAAANARRRERRRQQDEREAMANPPASAKSNEVWEDVAPVLDEAMDTLGHKDRDALLLRYFGNRSLREVGAALGISEDTAQKRVSRALEKLRSIFSRRGKAVSLAALETTLAANAVQATPPPLAGTIVTSVLAKGAGAGGAVTVLCEETLRLIAGARLRLALLQGVAALLVITILVLSLNHRSVTSPAQVGDSTGAPPQSSQPADPIRPAGQVAVAALQPGEKRFAFRVLDATNGAPLPGAKLTIMEIAEFPNRTTNEYVTDRNGFGLLIPPKAEVQNWNYRIEVYRDGYVPKYVSWGAGQGDVFAEFPTDYTTKAERAVRIGGTVQTETGNPIPGVSVVFSVSGPSPGASRDRERLTMMGNYHTEMTDGTGQWVCTHVPERFGMITWRLIHREYQDTTYGCQAAEADSSSGYTRLPKDDFLAGRALMSMKRGLVVAGSIVDEMGRPVQGAKVTQDHDFRKPEANLFTDADGRFRFQNAREKSLVLTVQADGFAPIDRTITPGPHLEEQRFTLTKGRVLRGRVVDEVGQPVAGASVRVSADPRNNETFEWRTRADEAGRFEWLTSPDPARLYSVSASGFESQGRVTLVADGTEQLITLKKSSGRKRLRVTANVVDAETREPVSEFKVLVSEKRNESSQIVTLGASPAGSGRDGKGTFAVSSYAVGFIAEFQSAGYLPARSTNANSGQGEVTLDIELTKARPFRGTVLRPDGQPAASATVVLCTPQDTARMQEAGQIKVGLSPTVMQAETDAHGAFSFPPRLEVTGVIIGHQEGFAMATTQQLGASQPIRLLPWGRIEGVFRIGNRAGAGETIDLNRLIWSRTFAPSLEIYLSAKTDSEGRFSFEGVPPGELRVQHRPSFRNGKIGEIPASQMVPIIVTAGETTPVTMGGSGRKVVGRIVAEGSAAAIDWLRDVHVLSLKVPALPVPTAPKREDFASVDQFTQAMQEHAERSESIWATEAGRANLRLRRQYVLLFKPDGSFEINDVPPGTYELRVTPRERADDNISSMNAKALGFLNQEVIVPEAGDADPELPVDLSVLQLKPAPPR